MQLERRALYNSLRQNWVLDPTLEVEPWQVEDYRALPLDTIFERMEDRQIYLDKSSFLTFAENVDSPEELCDGLTADFNLPPITQDQVYLLIFELWRRLLPEKQCLTIFCDELDHRIHLYDLGQMENPEEIQDALANLQVVLDENTDEGADPIEVFEGISSCCANNLETFLYDFIAEQIDNENYAYASELIDDFYEYIYEPKWFDFLRYRITIIQDPEGAQKLINMLIEDSKNEPDLEFNLELMASLVKGGDEKSFRRLLDQSLKLVKFEEDFQDLLSICIDFYRCLDKENVEQQIHHLLKKRSFIPLESIFNTKDQQVTELLKLLE